MTHATTTAVDQRQESGGPSVEVDGQRFRMRSARCSTQWLPEVKHKVRVVILWHRWNRTEPAKMLVTNHTHWEVTRVLRGYRGRWTGTETLHRDGKPHVGMGDCQLRNGEGQTRHLYHSGWLEKGENQSSSGTRLNLQKFS